MKETIIDAAKIARINELYHKSKAEGLTDAEKKEQQQLRQEESMFHRKTCLKLLKLLLQVKRRRTGSSVHRSAGSYPIMR